MGSMINNSILFELYDNSKNLPMLNSLLSVCSHKIIGSTHIHAFNEKKFRKAKEISRASCLIN